MLYEVVVRLFQPLNDTIAVRVLKVEARDVYVMDGALMLEQPTADPEQKVFHTFAPANWLSVMPCPDQTIQSS